MGTHAIILKEPLREAPDPSNSFTDDLRNSTQTPRTAEREVQTAAYRDTVLHQEEVVGDLLNPTRSSFCQACTSPAHTTDTVNAHSPNQPRDSL